MAATCAMASCTGIAPMDRTSPSRATERAWRWASPGVRRPKRVTSGSPRISDQMTKASRAMDPVWMTAMRAHANRNAASGPYARPMK